MKHYLKPVFTLASVLLLAAISFQAQAEEKIVIALKTHDFDLAETDISTLAIGEAKTIETDSGKVIDILRTTDGAEIYVDGELLEMHFGADGLHEEGLHEKHVIKKHVEVICEGDEECDKNVFVISGDDIDLEELHKMHEGGEGHKVIVIKKEIIEED